MFRGTDYTDTSTYSLFPPLMNDLYNKVNLKTQRGERGRMS